MKNPVAVLRLGCQGLPNYAYDMPMTLRPIFTFTVPEIIIIIGAVIVNEMPTVHIAESVFREYVDREGGYDEAKEEVKRVVRKGLDE